MKPGHGITGAKLEALCASGGFRPLGDCVLVEAIMEINASAAADGVDLSEGIEVDARGAIAWRVVALGYGVPATCGLAVNDVVMNVSIAGESVNPENKACRWYVIRLDHLVGAIPASLAYAEGYSPA